MEENRTQTTENEELDLDVDSIWERQDFTTSSVAYLNEVPVFSNSFKENKLLQENYENETQKNVLNQMFGENQIIVWENDVRIYLFDEKKEELIIHNQVSQYEVKPLYESLIILAIIGVFTICTVWLYGKKGTKKNVNNQHYKPVR